LTEPPEIPNRTGWHIITAMLILAFDTTSEHGGAGIFRDEQCLGIAENSERANYSVLLFEMVERLLAERQLELSAIDLFAVANGPGSFTGIRVGVAAAQGWATALGRPVCGVSVLAAMAELAQPEAEWAASIFDARRGEFYAALFQRVEKQSSQSAAAFEQQGDGWVSEPAALARTLAESVPDSAGLTCVVREHDAAAKGIRALFPETIRWREVKGTLVPAIARIALAVDASGRVQSPGELDACYIRRTDAELKLGQ
jgi:tRNA threonylcarbamoyladenosine biosynthesis protein TsaB